ncbi:MAG: hypothetical protein GWP08_08465 [Nitrospiraceae bacterium]|nr:hypothetical protein [Nitrospiraceae bacterium]
MTQKGTQPPRYWSVGEVFLLLLAVLRMKWLVALGVGILWAIPLGLGLYGFRQHDSGASWLDALYRTLQLIGMESGDKGSGMPWAIQVARFWLPLMTLTTLLGAFAVAFHRKLEIWSLKRLRHHTVICGLGEKGMALVRSFRAAKQRVAVIEVEDENNNIHKAWKLGAQVLIGDATDADILRAAGVDRASSVIAVCNDDNRNARTARSVCEHMKQYPGDWEEPLRCFYEILDLELCAELHRHDSIPAIKNLFEAKEFNIFETAARRLFRVYPLDLDPIGETSEEYVHLVVVGFSQMARAIILQALRINHYANALPSRITVIDDGVDRHKAILLNRYPALIDEMIVDYHTLDWRDARPDDPTVFAALVEWAQEPNAFTTIAICLDNDAKSLEYRFRLKEQLDQNKAGEKDGAKVRVCTHTASEPGLAGRPGEDGTGFCTFGSDREALTWETFNDNSLDTLARAIHERYRESQLAKGRPGNDAGLQPWDRLRPDFRDSCRKQADHHYVKLRAIGCTPVPFPEGCPDTQPLLDRGKELVQPHMELLARMEHARWCTERLLAGWRYAPEDDKERRESASLVPWDALTETVKDRDREPIRDIPDLFGEIGQCIVPQPEAQSSGRDTK